MRDPLPKRRYPRLKGSGFGRGPIGLLVGLLLLGATLTPALADQNAPELDALFARLQQPATDSLQAQRITSAIWRHWLKSDDREIERLMAKGINAMNHLNLHEAVESFSRITELAPNFAEGWNKRATAYYLLGRHRLSTQDVTTTLGLEPRHFGALSGQGMIYLQTDNKPAAIQFFKKALKVNPHMPTVRSNIQHLEQALDEGAI